MSPPTLLLEGLVLQGPDLEPVSGRVYVEGSRIAGIEARRPRREGLLIMPGLINAHTHVADCAFKDAGIGLPLRQLVSSPDGLKHRLLENLTEEQLASAISMAEAEMIRSGTTCFCDFREQGVRGVRALRSSVRSIRALAMGRPTGLGELERELEELVSVADGIGLESVSKYDDESLETVRRIASDKLVSVHALEAKRREGEVEKALDTLGADFLVHMTHATDEDLKMVHDRGRGVVLCPRSNLELVGKAPPIGEMIRREIPLALGTDNCMVNSLNMFREMELALHLTRQKDPLTVLQMATTRAAQILGVSNTGVIEEGREADLLVLRMDVNMQDARNIHAAVVKRADPQNVSMVVRGGREVYSEADLWKGKDAT